MPVFFMAYHFILMELSRLSVLQTKKIFIFEKNP